MKIRKNSNLTIDEWTNSLDHIAHAQQQAIAKDWNFNKTKSNLNFARIRKGFSDWKLVLGSHSKPKIRSIHFYFEKNVTFEIIKRSFCIWGWNQHWRRLEKDIRLCVARWHFKMFYNDVQYIGDFKEERWRHQNVGSFSFSSESSLCYNGTWLRWPPILNTKDFPA